jgi:putative oligomerization/nucleic acid binding protein
MDPTPGPPRASPAAEREDGRIVHALGQLESLLVPGERVEAYAVQRRLFALKHRRALVAATTGRFIGMTRHLLGGFQPQDVRWQDLKEVQLHVGTFGADLTIIALPGPDLAIAGGVRTLTYEGLRKAQAESVYRLCQASEQAWREKRRIRELEELRAKSGGIQLGSANLGAAAPPATAPAGTDAVAKLEQAKAMRDKGLITDSEYESLKARIVSNL